MKILTLLVLFLSLIHAAVFASDESEFSWHHSWEDAPLGSQLLDESQQEFSPYENGLIVGTEGQEVHLSHDANQNK